MNGLVPGEPVLATDAIQGDVLAGFGSDHQCFLGLRIADADAARPWLESLAARVATVEDVLAARGGATDDAPFAGPPEPWLNVSLSRSALDALGVPTRFKDEEFNAGHTNDVARVLGDRLPPDQWKVNAPGRPVEVLLNLACADGRKLDDEVDRVAAEATGAGLVETCRERGVRLKRGIEHFGFADGVSQPGFLGRRASAPDTPIISREWDEPPGPPTRIPYARPGKPLVWPGEFLFGQPKQTRGKREPGEPARAGEPGDPAPEWADNGSLLVFRRLEQDVAAFHTFLAEQAAALDAAGTWPGLTPALLGALIVGRWPDGSPVDLGAAGDGASRGALNDFSFGDDQGGERCPLAAHIRKVNPRFGQADTDPHERRVLRRGIPFGAALTSLADEDGGGGRGLLFACYQTSIHEQFAFLASAWMNDPDRPVGAAGHDVLVGLSDEPRKLTIRRPGGDIDLETEARWITPSGGQFLFAPSVTALGRLGPG